MCKSSAWAPIRRIASCSKRKEATTCSPRSVKVCTCTGGVSKRGKARFAMGIQPKILPISARTISRMSQQWRKPEGKKGEGKGDHCDDDNADDGGGDDDDKDDYDTDDADDDDDTDDDDGRIDNDDHDGHHQHDDHDINHEHYYQHSYYFV